MVKSKNNYMNKIEVFEQLRMDQNLRNHELNWINSLDKNGKLMFANLLKEK